MTTLLYQRLSEALEKAVAPMDEQQLLFHSEGKWSSSHILEHLALAFSGTSRMMEKALREDRPLGSNPTLKQRLTAFIVLEVKYFPAGRKAPKGVVPTGTLGGLEALDRIRGELKRMDELHGQCIQRFSPSAYLGNHPVLGPLKTSQWPKFHLVHTIHHMKQIERLKLLMGQQPAGAGGSLQGTRASSR